jgi:hypothetical protein
MRFHFGKRNIAKADHRYCHFQSVFSRNKLKGVEVFKTIVWPKTIPEDVFEKLGVPCEMEKRIRTDDLFHSMAPIFCF